MKLSELLTSPYLWFAVDAGYFLASWIVFSKLFESKSKGAPLSVPRAIAISSTPLITSLLLAMILAFLLDYPPGTTEAALIWVRLSKTSAPVMIAICLLMYSLGWRELAKSGEIVTPSAEGYGVVSVLRKPSEFAMYFAAFGLLVVIFLPWAILGWID